MNTNKNITPKKTQSTSRVTIMPSMDKTDKNCCNPAPGSVSDHRSYEKPGYSLSPYVDGFIATKAGPVPRIKTKLSAQDRVSTLLVRCGIHRYQYRVAPGLYCVGHPDKT
ncbi:MAG: hypothetical protein GY860_18145, partial [Desulfobacteraceae bacterium]|nr:hypothetical protein [Desulfobacteraceae bacterium]